MLWLVDDWASEQWLRLLLLSLESLLLGCLVSLFDPAPLRGMEYSDELRERRGADDSRVLPLDLVPASE